MKITKNNKEIFKINTMFHSTVVIEDHIQNKISCPNTTHVKHMVKRKTIADNKLGALNAVKITLLKSEPKIVTSRLDVHYVLMHTQKTDEINKYTKKGKTSYSTHPHKSSCIQ